MLTDVDTQLEIAGAHLDRLGADTLHGQLEQLYTATEATYRAVQWLHIYLQERHAEETPGDDERVRAAYDEYLGLAHSLQSGVALQLELNPLIGTPKDLCTGLNKCMVETSALISLLVECGVITNVQFVKALVKGMTQEVQAFEHMLSHHYKSTVHLH